LVWRRRLQRYARETGFYFLSIGHSVPCNLMSRGEF
jgi:hypothetical protein